MHKNKYLENTEKEARIYNIYILISKSLTDLKELYWNTVHH
jgi:hypothetical protein